MFSRGILSFQGGDGIFSIAPGDEVAPAALERIMANDIGSLVVKNAKG